MTEPQNSPLRAFPDLGLELPVLHDPHLAAKSAFGDLLKASMSHDINIILSKSSLRPAQALIGFAVECREKPEGWDWVFIQNDRMESGDLRVVIGKPRTASPAHLMHYEPGSLLGD